MAIWEVTASFEVSCGFVLRKGMLEVFESYESGKSQIFL